MPRGFATVAAGEVRGGVESRGPVCSGKPLHLGSPSGGCAVGRCQEDPSDLGFR